MDYNKYYEEHMSELLRQMYELGYDYHTIVEEAMKEDMNYREFIVTFLT